MTLWRTRIALVAIVVIVWGALRFYAVNVLELRRLATHYAGIIAGCANGKGFVVSNTAVLCYPTETR